METPKVLVLAVALIGLAAAVYALAVRALQNRAPRGRAARLPRPPDTARRPSLNVVVRTGRLPEVTEHPIVLCHGWLGFDTIGVPGVRSDYFRGVRAHLEAQGHTVYVSRVPGFAGVRKRAEALAHQLDYLGAEKANLIAHSMGGLDARYAISCLGLARRVASLTTIGTPHRGTPLADTGLILDRWLLARRALDGFSAHADGILDLSTSRMAAFNQQVLDAPDVAYASYVTWVHGGVRNVHTLLIPAYTFLRGRAGDNDGIVPASSQRWGRLLGELHADHWAQIGWSPGVDVRLFYGGIARMLARRGF